MSKKHGWLIVLMMVALVVVACGPEMATPTPGEKTDAGDSPTAAAVGKTPTAAEKEKEPTKEPVSAADLPVDEDDWHVLGSPDAEVTIVEYTDFQCPFCGKYANETYPQIVKDYVETGKVRYIFKNFPLYSIHPQAQKAAEAAECAGEQGKYWEMHDLLFGSQEQWSGKGDAVEIFKEMAGGLGVDQTQFDACLDGEMYADKVTADYQEGLKAGVTGTPAFRINGVAMSGAQSYATFQQQLDYFLAGGEPPTLEVPADSFRSMGQADAPVVVTEFSDYQCPACASIEQQVIPDLIEQYVDTGKVRFVYREFPLDNLHPSARSASEAAICAGKLGKYWEMHEKLFATGGEWGAEGANPAEHFEAYAEELGVDSQAFKECLASGEAAVIVRGDSLTGETLGVNATPYFFINDVPIRGGLPIEALGKVIDYVAAGGATPEILPSGEDWHVRGNTSMARAIAVAFVDYGNPQSSQHANEVLPQLKETFIDSGQLIYVLHPWSEESDSPGGQAAIAAECAGQQGKYWEMHGLLFENQGAWIEAGDPGSLFGEYAESLDLDMGEFEECLDSEWARLRLEGGNVVAAMYGVQAAPTFLFNNGQGQQGSPTFEEFQAVIESIINQ